MGSGNIFYRWYYATGESYLPGGYYENPAFIQQAGMFAARNLLITGGVCLLVGFLFMLCRFSPLVCYIIAFLAIIEIFGFAKNTLVYFNPASTQFSELKEFANNHGGDYRVLYLDNPNSAMTAGIQNIWGYDQESKAVCGVYGVYARGKSGLRQPVC